jgi:hypothetical protein
MGLQIHRPFFMSARNRLIDRQPSGEHQLPCGDAAFPRPSKESAMLNPSTVLPHQRVCVLLGGPLRAAPRVTPRIAALLRSAQRLPA